MSILSIQPEEPEFAGYLPDLDPNRTDFQIGEDANPGSGTNPAFWAQICSDQTATLAESAQRRASDAAITAAYTQALATDLPLRSFEAIMIDGDEWRGERLAVRARALQLEVPITARQAYVSQHQAEIIADDPAIGIAAPTRQLRQLAQCIVEASEADIVSLAPTDQVRLIQELATAVVASTWEVEGRGVATTTVRQGLIQQAINLASITNLADSRPNLVIVDEAPIDVIETEPTLFTWNTDPYPEINDDTTLTVTGLQRDTQRLMHHYNTSFNCGCESCRIPV